MLNIANPIYDVVFKYLMDDNRVAKKLLSLIIGQEIIDLQMQPSEMRSSISERAISILHIDFAALVNFGDKGYKQVIIELQKAKYHADIMRFRRYLGTQYANKNNIIKDEDESRPPHVLPILSIYFLGYPLDHITVPVIRVNRQYIDASSGKVIAEKDDFIESLTHDSIVIQIPALRQNRRTKLEQVLAVFDASNHHFINVEEKDYPPEYHEVLDRLLLAAAKPEIRANMEIEEEYLEELSEYERALLIKEQALMEKDQELEKKDQALVEKDQALVEKDQALIEKDQALRDSESKLTKAIDTLAKQMGISKEEAAKILS